MRVLSFVLCLSCLFFAAGHCANGSSAPATSQDQLKFLNEQIDSLQEERDRYLARSAWAQNQGDRLQFEEGQLIYARRYWDVAKISREIADKIDEELKKLEAQRDALLKSTQKR